MWEPLLQPILQLMGKTTSDYAQVKDYQVCTDQKHLIYSGILVGLWKKYSKERGQPSLEWLSPSLEELNQFLEWGNRNEEEWFSYIWRWLSTYGLLSIAMHTSIWKGNLALSIIVQKLSLNLYFWTGKTNYFHLIVTHLSDIFSWPPIVLEVFRCNFSHQQMAYDEVVEIVNGKIQKYLSRPSEKRLQLVSRCLPFITQMVFFFDKMLDVGEKAKTQTKIPEQHSSIQFIEKQLDYLGFFETNCLGKFGDASEDCSSCFTRKVAISCNSRYRSFPFWKKTLLRKDFNNSRRGKPETGQKNLTEEKGPIETNQCKVEANRQDDGRRRRKTKKKTMIPLGLDN